MSSRSLRSLPSIGSGQSLEDLSSRGTPSCLNHLLAYWSGCAPCVPKKLQQEDPVARMRCAPTPPHARGGGCMAVLGSEGVLAQIRKSLSSERGPAFASLGGPGF